MEEEILISAVKDISLVDVIEHPAFTIWFPYCNFRCPWCQNWSIVMGKEVMRIKLSKLLNMIEESAEFVDYVHVTGGEPTILDKQLRTLFSAVRSLGLKNSLNTNGSRPEIVKRLFREGLLDHVALDVKAPLSDTELYSKVIGLRTKSPVLKVKETVEFLIANLDFLELRTTFVPSLLKERDVVKVAVELSEMGCSDNCYWVLQQFVPAPEAPDAKFRKGGRIPPERLAEIARRAKEESGLKNVYIRTIEEGLRKI